MKIKLCGVALLVALCTSMLAACSGGGGGSTSNNTSANVQLSGIIDSNSMTASAKPTLLRKFLAALSVENAYAALPTVNKIVAISSDYSMAFGTISGNTFSLSLGKGKPYLLVFLNNTTVVGIYKVDSLTGLNTFPLTSSSTSLDLGTVSLSGGVLTGTITETSLLSGLGLDSALATAFGVMDVGFLRLSSVDVDGDGVLDFMENKQYDLHLDYEFSPGENFTTLSTMASYSSRTNVTYKGYEYYFFARPDDSTVNWTTATLNSPALISNGTTSAASAGQCWNQSDTHGRTLNFYCGGTAVSPATPPTGTYTVTASLVSGGTKTFTFLNLKSQNIDTNLYNIYIPEIKLTMNGNQVQQIDWKWWKKVNGTGWVQPTAVELSTVLNDSGFEIGDSMWSAANRIRGNITLTPTGSVQPAAQSFTPGHFRVSTYDKAGYNYGFEW